MNPLIYRSGIGAVALLARLLARWEVLNRKEVPQKGPLIVAANHMSFIDPPLLMASFPRPISFMAKEELFRTPWGSLFFGSFGVMPVKRHKADMKALRRALELLREGRALGVFPEGTRSRVGSLTRAEPGIGFIAYHSDAPILPMAIWGTEAVLGPLDLFSRPRIKVHIGEPFLLPRVEGPQRSVAFQAAADQVMERVAALMPPAYRGVYGDKVLLE